MSIPEPLRVRLSAKAREGVSSYQSEYISSFHEIIDAHTENYRVSGSVAATDAKDASLSVKISSLYNDVTFLELDAGRTPTISWMTEKGWKDIAGGDTIELTVRGDVPEKMKAAIKAGQISIGFMFPGDDAPSAMLADAAYLISDGRLVPRPKRMFIYLQDTDENGRRTWAMLSAEPETAGNAWSVSTEKIETSVHSLSFATPMPPADHLATLSEITLPYIEGLSLSDHARIIRDEEDILNEFRKEMRQLAQMASERKIHVDEFRRDVIDPRVSRISRKLKHISNMHLIKTSGAVFVTCALSLIASQSKGMLGGLEVMVGGAGAASMVKDVVDRENQIHALKDDPLFLLWKMSQRSQ